MSHARATAPALRITLAASVGFAAAACTATEAEQRAPRRPNVLLILIDDLGTEALSTYGGTSYSTPHVDALAADGMVFERAFATPVCTPTRVQLLTGNYPFRTGWTMGEWNREAGDRIVDPSLPSVARMLRDAGYATAIAGKWQLSRPYEAPDHPSDFGFDRHLLWTYHASATSGLTSRFWAPSLVEDGVLRDDLARDELYGPDLLCAFLEDFVEEQVEAGRPFFAYYSMTLVHRPYVTTPPNALPLDAPVADAPWKTEDDLERFASNVAYMDELVGRLLATLDRTGATDDTLVLLTADNGTDSRITSAVGERLVGGGKTRMNDVGSLVPMIARWPGVVASGKRSDALVDFTDVLPTLADVTGARRPSASVDGRSFAPLLRGAPSGSREWVLVQSMEKWYLRDAAYRLHEDGALFDVRDPFQALETPVETVEARAARARLEAVARELFAE